MNKNKPLIQVPLLKINSYSYVLYTFIPEQELVLEHTPSISTVWLLQKQPLVQGESDLHPLTPVMLLQDKFQLQS